MIGSVTEKAAPLRDPTVTPKSAADPAASSYRIGAAQLLQAQSALRAAGPLRGAIQSVLQTLRWDPMEGHRVQIHADPDGRRDGTLVGGRLAGAEGGTAEVWPVITDPAVIAWLAKQGVGVGTTWLGASPYLLEVCACVAAGLGSDAETQASLAMLRAHKAGGGRAVHASGPNFFWRRTYHLAFVQRGEVGQEAEATLWYAEGGQYLRRGGTQDRAPWRRRPRSGVRREADNQRPAENFDPEADYRLAGLADAQRVTGPADGLPAVPFQPFVARVAPLRPWPRHCFDPAAWPLSLDIALPTEDSRLAAWYAPQNSDGRFTWQASPPLPWAVAR